MNDSEYLYATTGFCYREILVDGAYLQKRGEQTLQGVFARSEAEAVGMALANLKAAYPVDDGYLQHDVLVLLIPPEALEQGLAAYGQVALRPGGDPDLAKYGD